MRPVHQHKQRVFTAALFLLLSASIAVAGPVEKNNAVEAQLRTDYPSIAFEFANILPQNGRLIAAEYRRVHGILPGLPIRAVDCYGAGPDTKAWASTDEYRGYECRITFGNTFHRRTTEGTPWRYRHEAGHVLDYTLTYRLGAAAEIRAFQRARFWDDHRFANAVAAWIETPWAEPKGKVEHARNIRDLTGLLKPYRAQLETRFVSVWPMPAAD